jgi:hypothetical protein
MCIISSMTETTAREKSCATRNEMSHYNTSLPNKLVGSVNWKFTTFLGSLTCGFAATNSLHTNPEHKSGFYMACEFAAVTRHEYLASLIRETKFICYLPYRPTSSPCLERTNYPNCEFELNADFCILFPRCISKSVRLIHPQVQPCLATDQTYFREIWKLHALTRFAQIPRVLTTCNRPVTISDETTLSFDSSYPTIAIEDCPQNSNGQMVRRFPWPVTYCAEQKIFFRQIVCLDYPNSLIEYHVSTSCR